MTPHQLAGQTAKMLGLPIELARNRTGDSQKAWLNGYAQAMPLQTQKDRNRGRVLQQPRNP
jgi:hypothetical protein